MVKEKTEIERGAKQRLRGFARDMRQQPTESERNFWRAVRDRRFMGHKFKRQFPVGNYIADFVCLEYRLIVGLDGGEHETSKEYDQVRDAFLESRGYRVVRFENWPVNSDIESVLEILKHEIDTGTPSPRPSPPEGERG